MKYNYNQVIHIIENTRRFGNLTGYEVSKCMLEQLGNPQNAIPFVHIAGTNGKGSTTAFLCKILEKAGMKVGMFTSPHLVTFEERIRINGIMISKEDVIRLGNFLLETKFEVSPTMFDYCLAMAVLYFAEQKCDIMVMETGIGGRYDSTNALGIPMVSVITKIGFDHMGVLGDTLEQIAWEKAGIIKQGVPVVTQRQEECVRNVLYKTFQEVNHITDDTNSDFIEVSDAILDEVAKIPMKMKGNFQIENAGTALLTASVIFLNLGKRKNYKNSSYEKKASSINKNETDADDGNNHLDNVSNIQKQTILQLEKELQNCKYACSIFDILKDISDVQKSYICCGISETVWKGRMELINDSPFFMIDGAHNSHGVHALAESLKTLYPNEKFHFIMAVMADKDYENMIEELIPLALDFITVTPESNRALQAKDLAECIAKKGIKAVFAEDIKTVIEPLLPKTRIQQDKMDKSSLQQNSKGNLTSFHIENSNTENWNTAKTIINAKKSTSSQKTIAFGSLYFIGEIEAML